jgi:hypothetical protein
MKIGKMMPTWKKLPVVVISIVNSKFGKKSEWNSPIPKPIPFPSLASKQPLGSLVLMSVCV